MIDLSLSKRERNVYEIMRIAIKNKGQVWFTYRGLERRCCPHALGRRGEQYRILCFQFAGESSKDLPLDGEWRCFLLSQITQIRMRKGAWYTGKSHKRMQSCISVVHYQVKYDHE